MLPKTDTTPDAKILINAYRKGNRWSYETVAKFYFASRAAGVLYGATRHTLLAFALTSALKSLKPAGVRRHLVSSGQYASDEAVIAAKAKMRVTVVTSEQEFANELERLRKTPAHTLRCAPRIVRVLVKELRRFHITIQVDKPIVFGRLIAFSNGLVLSPKLADGWPTPAIVSST